MFFETKFLICSNVFSQGEVPLPFLEYPLSALVIFLHSEVWNRGMCTHWRTQLDGIDHALIAIHPSLSEIVCVVDGISLIPPPLGGGEKLI